MTLQGALNLPSFHQTWALHCSILSVTMQWWGEKSWIQIQLKRKWDANWCKRCNNLLLTSSFVTMLLLFFFKTLWKETFKKTLFHSIHNIISNYNLFWLDKTYWPYNSPPHTNPMLPLSLQFRVEEENMPETNGCISEQLKMESNGWRLIIGTHWMWNRSLT